MTRFRSSLRNEIPAQGRDDTPEMVVMTFGGASEAAADRCDRTGGAPVTEAK